MHYTLAELLSDGIIPEAVLLTGEDGASACVIDAVSVQELPVDGFIRPGELVLSTGIGCSDEATFVRLIEDVVRGGATAMMLTFRDPGFAVPGIVVRRAKELGLALARIPWEYRFSEITSFVLRRIQAKKTESFQRIQTELFNLYFEAHPLSDAADAVAAFFGTGVIITDGDGNIRAKSGESDVTDACSYTLDIGINDNISGRLLLSGDGGDLGAETELVKRYISFPLSMWFNQERVETLMVTKFKNDFVWNLAAGNYDSVDEMARQGEKLQFDISKPYTCAVMKAVPKEPSPVSFGYSMEAARCAAAFEGIIRAECDSLGLGIMCADRGMEFILFVENPAERAEDTVTGCISAACLQLQSSFPAYDFYWGISEITPDLHDFSRLYKNASLALGYCMNSRSGRHSFTFKDTREAQIMSVLSASEDVRKIAAETLGALLEYDRTSHADLLGTLTAYISCGCNSSLTARSLHIHRQSLLYRLERITALTGMELHDRRDMFLLEICTRIYADY